MQYSVTKNYVLRKIVDESILVPISPSLKERDCLYVLNLSGSLIYEGVKQGKSKDEIHKILIHEFDELPLERLQEDQDTFLSKMIDIEAMTVTNV